MSIQPHKLNAEDQRVYDTWLHNMILLWTFVLVTMATVCTVLSLETKVSPEQRATLMQQSGIYP